MHGARMGNIKYMRDKLTAHADRTAGAITAMTILWGWVQDLKSVEIAVIAWVVFVSALWALKNMKEHNLKFPPRDKREDRSYNVLENYFLRKSIRLIDFVDSHSIILEGKVFEECRIYGPAYLMDLGGSRFHDMSVTIGINLEEVLLEIEPGRHIRGAIGVKDCVFKKCTFVDVGFMGLKSFIDGIRSVFGNVPR